MSYYYPQDSDSLMLIYGVGNAKEKKYGSDFLQVIREYTTEKGIEERSKDIEKKKIRHSDKKKHHRVGEEYNAGKSIEHLAEQNGVKVATILANLKKYYDEGFDLSPDGLLAASSLSQRKKDEVKKAMDKHGPELLKPIYEELDKSVDYSELRVMQLYYMANNK
jgi:ATP-dependent DNA helicase RecQ